jgi:hypothetical protein
MLVRRNPTQHPGQAAQSQWLIFQAVRVVADGGITSPREVVLVLSDKLERVWARLTATAAARHIEGGQKRPAGLDPWRIRSLAGGL